MKLDLGGFKKIHEDQKSATLLHPTGHKIVVDKGKLNPNLVKQLANLKNYAYGGEVDESNNHDNEYVDNYPSLEANTDPNRMEISPDYVPIEPSDEVPRSIPNMQNQDPEIRYPQFTGNRSPALGAMVIESDKAAPTQNPSQDETGMEAPKMAMPTMPQATNKKGYPLPDLSQFIGQYGEAYQNMGNAALKAGEAQAQGIQATKQAQQIGSEELATLHQQAQDTQNRILGEADNVIHDMSNGHINPNQYLEQKSTANKITRGIGLLLGGIGGGLLGQENPALKFLNEQIDRNILSQQKNFENQNTIFHAYLNKFGDVQKATDMSKGILQLKMANDISLAGANANSDMARQQAQLLSQKFRVEALQTMMPIAMKQTAINFMRQHPNVDPSVASTVMHQVGIIPDKDKEEIDKEIAKAREVESMRQAMKRSYDKINDLAGRGALSPAMRSAEINSLAGRAVKIGEGRFNFQEAAQQMDAFIPRRFEGADTTNEKPHLIDQWADSMRNEATGPGWGITVPKGNVSAIQRNRNIGPNYPRHRGK